MDLVECHSGFAYTDQPRAFIWEGLRLRVAKILTQGRTPQVKWYRVITEDRQVFELSYHEETDDWQIRSI
jgi:hypothetical protein